MSMQARRVEVNGDIELWEGPTMHGCWSPGIVKGDVSIYAWAHPQGFAVHQQWFPGAICVAGPEHCNFEIGVF